MTKKILFTGYYGFNNFGDDLFGLACVNGLKNAGGDFLAVILSPPVKGVKAKYLVPGVLGELYKSRSFVGKFLRIIFMIYGCLRYREVVLSGGSVILSGASFHTRLIQYYLARLGVCRLSAIGVSIGPFSSEKDRVNAKRFINILSYLCVRDEASIIECNILGVDIDVSLYNDLAGCAPLPAVDETKTNNRILGVSVCRYESLVGGDSEKENLRNIAIFEGISDFATEHKFIVRILILNANALVGDVLISKRLYDYLSGNGVPVTIVQYDNPIESLKKISECEAFFSVRLHGAISAYLLSVPFVLVEYHEKCKDFLDYIGVDRRSRISASVADKETVVSCLEKVIQVKNDFSVKPKDYIEGANKIFMRSPWSI